MPLELYFKTGEEELALLASQIDKWAEEHKLPIVKSPPVFPKPIFKDEINLVKLETFCELYLDEKFDSDAGTPLIRH